MGPATLSHDQPASQWQLGHQMNRPFNSVKQNKHFTHLYYFKIFIDCSVVKYKHY